MTPSPLMLLFAHSPTNYAPDSNLINGFFVVKSLFRFSRMRLKKAVSLIELLLLPIEPRAPSIQRDVTESGIFFI